MGRAARAQDAGPDDRGVVERLDRGDVVVAGGEVDAAACVVSVDLRGHGVAAADDDVRAGHRDAEAHSRRDVAEADAGDVHDAPRDVIRLDEAA